MEEELLKWMVTVPRRKIITKRNWAITISAGVFYIILFLRIFLFTPSKNPLYIQILFSIFIFSLPIVLLFWILLSNATFEFRVTNQGISKIDISRSGKVTEPREFVINYHKFWSRIFGKYTSSTFYMPYKAISYYHMSGDLIELVP